MKILAYVHGYPPNLNGGAEFMLHQILLDLKNRGHEVVVVTNSNNLKEYEGIRLYNVKSSGYRELFEWCDLVFTHLLFTRRVMRLSKAYKKKVIHLLHNDIDIRVHNVLGFATHNVNAAALIVANSNWVQNTINGKLPSIVVNPPTRLKNYKTETTKEFVTLINLAYDKGGKLFWELAEAMPDVQFMGVLGGWGEQVLKKDFPNVTILKNTTDIKSVYSKTKILLLPSYYESWGRVAIEAACSRIPVIATPMPGPKESLGDAAIFANVDNLPEWYEAIKRLDDEKTYSKYSEAVKKRAEELDKEFDNQIDLLEKKLLEIVSKT
jgi:glycosyltransferase involved in cell wall biosynthesis